MRVRAGIQFIKFVRKENYKKPFYLDPLMEQKLDRLQLILVSILFVIFGILTVGMFGLDSMSDQDNLEQVYLNETEFTDVYFTMYPCTFLQCLFDEDTREVLFSEQGNGFASRTKWFLLLGMIILTALLVVRSGTAKKGLRNFGIVLFLIGLTAVIPQFLPLYDTLYGKAVDMILLYEFFFQDILIPLFVLGGLGVVSILVWVGWTVKEKHQNAKPKKK